MSTSNNPQQPQSKIYKLTTKNLFKHFLLVHDFLYKFTKTNATDEKFLDAQIDVQNIMNSATTNGGRFGQVSSLAFVATYCLTTSNIPLKFLAGFLYVYWLNHSYTLGQYFGALIRMPTAYKRVGQYFEKYNSQHPNLLDNFQHIMENQNDYDDTHPIIQKLFPQFYQVKPNTYISNEFFVKNRQKYNLPSQGYSYSVKLPYLDSFITRYVYYSFTRWLHRVNLFLGLAQQ